MGRLTQPRYSKTQVNKAGDAIRSRALNAEVYDVIENWRASHAYILNTFQASLRNKTKNTETVFAQRLKRWPTIIDKLSRENGMQLARMHDIAGCRLIFSNEISLRDFQNEFRNSRFQHKLINADDRYDYIKNPKISGYRGIHDVYAYDVRSKGGQPWNGLHIEIQYRTIYQHAWATAVEIAGSISANNPKFNRGDERYYNFFQLSSEYIARKYENSFGPLRDLNDNELSEKFLQIEREIGLLKSLQGLNIYTKQFKNTKYVILIMNKNNYSLDVKTYTDQAQALSEYSNLERNQDVNIDVVLVKSDSDDKIRNAFRNYFSDAGEFVRMLSSILE